MKKTCVIAAGIFCASAAVAHPVLQMDINGFSSQATDGANPSAFGGLSHTGAVVFSLGAGAINQIARQNAPATSFVNQNFVGTLTGFSGQVNMVNGQVTGGSLLVQINGGTDSYSANIQASGGVSNYIGGGYKIEGLTHQGVFSDATFGNVDVSDWFNQVLNGSFLQFNFDPNANGFAAGDMDLFVQVVPLPPAVWAGLGTMGCIAVMRIRKRA